MEKRLRLKICFVLSLLSLSIYQGLTQTGTPPTGISELEYTESSLNSFKLKMDSLKSGTRKKVRIVHIGDFHIQPDKFSGKIRNELQDKYGNGGRGFIFPYAAAKTNGPKDYTSATCANWTRCRNVDYNSKLPIGLAGMMIKSLDDSGSVNVHVGYDSLPNTFSKATLIFSGQEGMEVCLNRTSIKQCIKLRNLPYDTISWVSNNTDRDLSVAFRNGNLSLYGLYVENEAPGIIYNAIGVAGARFTDYNHTAYFFQQLGLLNADLVIISLGTNESYSSHYTDTAFLATAKLFLSEVKKACPGADIILTCPSENYHVRNHQPIENPQVAKANAVLRTLAREDKLAIWDLYKAMGGRGSMKAWKKEGLVNPDYIHFLKGGYKLQGELFSKALVEFVER
ncbi:MAG: GDSL-type esterase/lipase family protein [Bacteroidia bacterium]